MHIAHTKPILYGSEVCSGTLMYIVRPFSLESCFQQNSAAPSDACSRKFLSYVSYDYRVCPAVCVHTQTAVCFVNTMDLLLGDHCCGHTLLKCYKTTHVCMMTPLGNFLQRWNGLLIACQEHATRVSTGLPLRRHPFCNGMMIVYLNMQQALGYA